MGTQHRYSNANSLGGVAPRPVFYSTFAKTCGYPVFARRVHRNPSYALPEHMCNSDSSYKSKEGGPVLEIFEHGILSKYNEPQMSLTPPDSRLGICALFERGQTSLRFERNKNEILITNGDRPFLSGQ